MYRKINIIYSKKSRLHYFLVTIVPVCYRPLVPGSKLGPGGGRSHSEYCTNKVINSWAPHSCVVCYLPIADQNSLYGSGPIIGFFSQLLPVSPGQPKSVQNNLYECLTNSRLAHSRSLYGSGPIIL